MHADSEKCRQDICSKEERVLRTTRLLLRAPALIYTTAYNKCQLIRFHSLSERERGRTKPIEIEQDRES